VYKKHLGFAVTLLSLGLFFPGILLTMFKLDMGMAVDVSGSILSSTLVNKELSLMATIQELWQDQRFFVAVLIFLFSVCIPILKTLILSLAYFTQNRMLESRLVSFVRSIGKWSMADVFVVAVFLAILSTNHADTASTQTISIFGFKILFEVSTQTMSAVGEGFYYFSAYCLFSMLGTQITASYLRPKQPSGITT
jgi:paraquat-inducible protein A